MIQKVLHTPAGKLLIQLPSLLSEITLGQVIALQERETKLLDEVAILSNTPLEKLSTATVLDVNELIPHMQSIAHQMKYADIAKMPMPETVTIGGVKLNVINNLQVEPVGAYWNCREIMADEINRHIEIHGEEEGYVYTPKAVSSLMVLSHYFYCRATGLPYDDKMIEAFSEKVKLLPITQAFPIARFFFLNYPELSKPKTSYFHRLLLNLKRKLGLKVTDPSVM